MDGMSESDVITPSADLVRERLAAAISIKQQMALGSYPDKAVAIAQAMITALSFGQQSHLLRQRGIRPGCRPPRRRIHGTLRI